MIIDFPSQPSDDPTFITNLCGYVARQISDVEPDVCWVVRIGKWFDHKWLRYSGKGRVRFDGGPIAMDTALDPFRQDQLTFPPFNPKQVTAQHGWVRSPAGVYEAAAEATPPHGSSRAHSATNLHRRVRDFAPSGLFVWFSSHTEPNRRASLMTYVVSQTSEETWYASLSSSSGWRLERVKGIDESLARDLFPLG